MGRQLYQHSSELRQLIAILDIAFVHDLEIIARITMRHLLYAGLIVATQASLSEEWAYVPLEREGNFSNSTF